MTEDEVQNIAPSTQSKAQYCNFYFKLLQQLLVDQLQHVIVTNLRTHAIEIPLNCCDHHFSQGISNLAWDLNSSSDVVFTIEGNIFDSCTLE